MSDKVTWETPTTYNIREDKNVKPCPVCNQKNTLVLKTNYWSEGWGMGESYGYDMTIKCTQCGMSVHNRNMAETHRDQYFEEYKNKIVKKWNKIAANRQSIIAVTNKEPRLRWTKEKPTEIGYYWYSNLFTDEFQLGKAGVVAVIDTGDTGLAAYSPGDEYPVLLSEAKLSGLWSGPIPKPEE